MKKLIIPILLFFFALPALADSVLVDQSSSNTYFELGTGGTVDLMSFTVSSDTVLTRAIIYGIDYGSGAYLPSCLTSTMNFTNDSSGCITSVTNVEPTQTYPNWEALEIDLENTFVSAGTYYLKFFSEVGVTKLFESQSTNAYAGGCLYHGSASCYSSGNYDLKFQVYEDSSICGNDSVEPGEQCDDGNTENGDGCSSICQLEDCTCGDSLISFFDNEYGFCYEYCDDGNTDNYDGCSAWCSIETTNLVNMSGLNNNAIEVAGGYLNSLKWLLILIVAICIALIAIQFFI